MTEEYAGNPLRVDLEKEKIERFTVDGKTPRKLDGGTGMEAKFFCGEAHPRTEWFDPRSWRTEQ